MKEIFIPDPVDLAVIDGSEDLFIQNIPAPGVVIRKKASGDTVYLSVS